MDQANGCHRNAFERSEGDNESAESGKMAVVPPQPSEPSGERAERPARAERSDGLPARADRSESGQQTLIDWLGHELRNPIAAIELAVHSLRQLSDSRLDHSLSILERQSEQLGRVVLELLEMARAISQPPGIGLPMRYLPREDDPARVPPRERMPGPRGSDGAHRGRLAAGTGPLRRRLLLVEDNEDLSDLLRELLTEWGFDVIAASSALAALAKAAVRPPDVALIDIGLPDRDGCEVARTLRRSLPRSVRLIAMSGYGQRHDGARALAAGFDEFLVKPLNTTRLRALLGEIPNLSLPVSGPEK